jgi:uncharacterized Zn-finger protein
MQPKKFIEVEPGVASVSCDGGGTLGHPRVYLALGEAGFVDCYYCGQRFVTRTGRRPDGAPADDSRRTA